MRIRALLSPDTRESETGVKVYIKSAAHARCWRWGRAGEGGAGAPRDLPGEGETRLPPPLSQARK